MTDIVIVLMTERMKRTATISIFPAPMDNSPAPRITIVFIHPTFVMATLIVPTAKMNLIVRSTTAVTMKQVVVVTLLNVFLMSGYVTVKMTAVTGPMNPHRSVNKKGKIRYQLLLDVRVVMVLSRADLEIV